MSHVSNLISRYTAGAPVLWYATHGLAPEHGIARPGPGAWSLAELAAHLVDADLVLADRMKRVIAEDDPVLLAFDEQKWVARLGSDLMPIEESVNLFMANRHWVRQILCRCTKDDFARAGRHSEAGRLTLAEIVSKSTTHLDHHLRFLYGKRANLGVAIPPRYTVAA